MDSKDDIDHLAYLCRIDCTEEEKKYFSKNLEKVFKYISQLNEIDTEGVEPYTRLFETMVNVMREDDEVVAWNREQLLINAPEHVGGMIKVPPVMKNENV